jgi:hypothetical protein
MFAFYVIASIVTLLGAYFLWESGHKVLAAELILVSPFPCPPGIPC